MQQGQSGKNKEKRLRAIMAVILVAIIVISVVFVLSNNQNEIKTHTVSIDGKGDYSSIGEAIDSASDNDKIFVSNGIYFENIKINGSIELIGEDKDTTIINGNGSGIVIDISADNVKISGFTIMNGGSNSADAGIEIRSNYNTISDCNISSNKNYGIYFYSDATNTITNNIIRSNIFINNRYGIKSLYAKTGDISSNTFTSNTEYGIYLESLSNDNLISDNTFTENNYALRIKGSTTNTITKNRIANNNYGLYFCCGARSNTVYNNFFINNTNWNANDLIGNTWDNGIVGNYWSDYNGTDGNGDGIGDTPYTITGGKYVDNLPLMKSI